MILNPNSLVSGKAFKKRKMNNNGGPRMIRNRAPPPINTLTAIRGPPLSSAAARQIMWDQYFPWVQGTYGDAAKTKTITTKKYARIVALLKSLTCGNSSLAPVLDKVPSIYYVITFRGRDRYTYRVLRTIQMKLILLRI